VPILTILTVTGYITKFLLNSIPDISELVPRDEFTGYDVKMDITVLLLFGPPYVGLYFPPPGHFNKELIKQLGFDFLVRMDLFTG